MSEPPDFVKGPSEPTSVRERLDAARPRHEPSHALYPIVLGVFVFFLVLAVSARQAAAPENAEKLLEAGVETIAGPDLVLLENSRQLREAAEAGTFPVLPVPGYPLPVYLSREEVLTLSDEGLRQLVLQRSAALVYTRGLEAFDRTGRQSLGTFSSQGVLELAAGQISDSAYDRASLVSAILAFLVAGAAAAVVLRQTGFARLRALGFGVAGGALPGLLLFVAFRLWASAWGGGDDFARGLRAIANALVDIPLRNYGVVFALGLAIAALSPALAFVARRFPVEAEAAPVGTAATDADEDSS
ncbi:MAG: hypothetical protein IT304_03190 [Dehalococcoidia bacterium]|nr:hypothetical protein [Dehalococcoidia bacterium]